MRVSVQAAPSDRGSEAHEEDDDLESLNGDGQEEVSSDELVRSTFSFLFPNTFQDILPVYNHKVGSELGSRAQDAGCGSLK